MKFELDRGKLLDMLVGHTIYNDPNVAIRELLQNAIDAVRFKFYLDTQGKEDSEIEKMKMGDVNVLWNPELRELIVEDNGIGMDLDTIIYHLMRVGSSFYDTPKFRIDNQDFIPISRFGIGILTCFMISDDIEIITCRDKIGHRIRMKSVQAEYLLKTLSHGDHELKGLEPNGTKVKIRLRSSVDLEKITIIDIVRYWVILPACNIFFIEKSKEPIKIGYSSVAEAMEKIVLQKIIDNKAPDEIKKYEIIPKKFTLGKEEYEIAILVYEGFISQKTFVTPKRGVSVWELYPAVCIEGIRVDNFLPGLRIDLAVLLSVKNNRNFRTTVSRSSLERDDEYIKVSDICIRLLVEHIKEEIKRISNLSGNPFSQASTIGLWMFDRLLTELYNVSTSERIEAYKLDAPLIVKEELEINTDNVNVKRELITPNELKNLSEFYTIESRLVNYLGILSRDLGRELSLNSFLYKMAPELQDTKINPIITDDNHFTKYYYTTHVPVEVNFSRQNLQTVIKWTREVNYQNIFELITDDDKNVFSDVLREYNLQVERRDVLKFVEEFRLFFSEIKGDLSGIQMVISKNAIFLNINHELKSQVLTLVQLLMQTTCSPSKLALRERAILILFYYILLSHFHEDSPGRALYVRRDRITQIYYKSVADQVNNILIKHKINSSFPLNIDLLVSNDQIFNVTRYMHTWDKE